MRQHPSTHFEPRKTPIQARSSASVEAILEATIQVLLALGKEKLTTTRVAHRAGVSVGTLYQYFPNKSALLQAALERHLQEVAEAVETVCEQQRGAAPHAMAIALITAFLAAKMKDPKTSVALYTVSSDLDAARIVKLNAARFHQSIARMLETSAQPLRNPSLAAAMLQATLVGVSRRLLDEPSPETQLPIFRRELIQMACAYLDACAPGRTPL